MNRLLVLGDGGLQARWLHQLLAGLRPSPRYSSHAADGVADCGGLLILDDGGEAGARALLSALTVRESNPEVPLAVIRSIDRSWSDAEALTRSLAAGRDAGAPLRISEARMRAAISAARREFNVRISPDAIQFEYSGE